MKKLLDPFTYYSGGTTLCAGAAIMAAMVVTAGCTGQTFRGVISLGVGEQPMGLLALHLTAGWAIFSALLYGGALWLSASRVRIIDIAGNQALAKLPYLLLLLGTLLYPMQAMEADLQVLSGWTPDLAAATPQEMPPVPLRLTLYGMGSVICLTLYLFWSWRGFSIAANLRGWRAAALYVAALLLADFATGMLLRQIAAL